jgi:glucose/arabinose dehydrogenase
MSRAWATPDSRRGRWWGRCRALTVVVAVTLCVSTGPAGSSGLSTNINFQPAVADVPSGYLPDTGAAYGDRGNGYTYGWNVDSTGSTRDRNSSISPDQRYDTLNHMQLYGSITWEIAVPNGTFVVHVVGGDPDHYDEVLKIAVEGVLTVDGTPTSSSPWVEGTSTVTVADGKLTVSNAVGASNNKISFLEISQVTASGRSPPATPVITEPATDGQIVHPADVHMETAPFSDPDPGDAHACTDWEIRVAATSEQVWRDLCDSVNLVHVHLGDGGFVNSYAGRTELVNDTDYVLRARHRDNSGDAATEWSAWAERRFRTAPAPAPGTAVAWTLKQPGFQLDVIATGLQLPVNIAFVPNPGTKPTSPYLYVTELYGNIKVVARDGTVSDYVRGTLNYRPSGIFPGSGEQGLTGLVVDPATGDVFASMLYEASVGGPHYPKIVHFRSNETGSVAGSYSTILDMPGEAQGQSHQISNLSIGPDHKLYAHMGDGFDTSTAQNLNSFRGKILRMNLDGSPAADNPFYDPNDGITSKDYVFAYGFRNPFGGDWRAADGFHYEVENGPSVDRFAKIVPGRNYLWDGTDASMHNFAIYNWSPAVAPVNLAFVQPQTFAGSGFPPEKMGHAFVSESGATYATGPQTYGKRITEFALDANGNLVSGPTPLLEYSGTGKATVAGLAAGPDGLYFTELYKDLNYTSPTDAGANILRIRYVGTANVPPSVSIVNPANGASYSAPATITINAAASDPDGSVTKVEFFQGGTKLGEDTSAPYSFTWSGVSAGSYSLTAAATDNAGSTSTSAPVNVTVSAASAADFTVSASPSVRNIRRGTSTSFSVSATPAGGFTGNVTFSVGPLPSGVTATFNPNPVSITSSTTSGSSSLTLASTATASVGTFRLTIVGTSGSLQRTMSVTLNVRK